MANLDSIKDTVCVVTYNHEKYIAECLQSLVDQETDFSFEIIVGDDCSTDNTREIIQDFYNRYPEVIKPIFNDRNLGATRNYFNVHNRANGVYVFHMDGDDVAYPSKLQVQADYLDKNIDMVCCWHQAQVFSDGGLLRNVREAKLDEIVDSSNLGLSDFLKYGVLGCHSSLAYRRKYFEGIRLLDGEMLDYYIAIHLLAQGNGSSISQVLGGYRFNPGASTASNGKFFIFKGSPLKKVYLSHLQLFYKQYPVHSDCIFFNSFYNFIVELSKLRLNLAAGFLLLSLRSIRRRAVASFYYDFVRFRKACK